MPVEDHNKWALAEPVGHAPATPAASYATVEELWRDVETMFQDCNPIEWLRGADLENYFQALKACLRPDARWDAVVPARVFEPSGATGRHDGGGASHGRRLR